MPLYLYRCDDGHEEERLSYSSVDSLPCIEGCKKEAARVRVNRVGVGRFDMTEHRPEPSVRDAMTAAQGSRKEVVAAVTEAIGNGWTPQEI